ncbi:hypothetical protein L3476_13850 [Paenibacillus thiaminolyticus]|uniref:hypothetical protein n=1 Tax=Paenibacillus thiaminolyticus TaxID=49283 RepID=UPI00234FBCA8|nr:hypothetical protein [Paenibacillus thiaminolyticus]WCR29704.1 hypothetical protein L3476_13850 [Paenibacillus thiaminolyticus]
MLRNNKFFKILFLMVLVFSLGVTLVSAAVDEKKIYGPNEFYSLDHGGVTTATFISDGKDIQINAYASKDYSQDTGTYTITLLKEYWFDGKYVSEGSQSFTYHPDRPTYVGTWKGVGKGTYKVTIQRESSDTGTISGSITVYAKY